VYRASVRRELFTRLVWSGRVWPCGLARACSRSSRGVERRGMQTSTPPSRCGPQYSPHAACCECNGKVAESQPGRGRTDSQVLLRHWLRSSRITTFIILPPQSRVQQSNHCCVLGTTARVGRSIDQTGLHGGVLVSVVTLIRRRWYCTPGKGREREKT
jgi:hypothetical protein